MINLWLAYIANQHGDIKRSRLHFVPIFWGKSIKSCLLLVVKGIRQTSSAVKWFSRHVQNSRIMSCPCELVALVNILVTRLHRNLPER